MPELSEDAICEGIVNAVAHRNYRSIASVHIYLFKDRIEIVSPGGLPAGMEEADLGLKSVPRNPLLFGMLYRMDVVEQIGSGIRRIRQLCREHEVAEPVIDVSEHWVTTTFFRPTAQVGSGEEESRPESESLEQRVFTQLQKGPMTKLDIVKGLGQKAVSGQLNKVIRALLSAGAIEYTIPEKPNSRLQQYRLTDKDV